MPQHLVNVGFFPLEGSSMVVYSGMLLAALAARAAAAVPGMLLLALAARAAATVPVTNATVPLWTSNYFQLPEAWLRPESRPAPSPLHLLSRSPRLPHLHPPYLPAATKRLPLPPFPSALPGLGFGLRCVAAGWVRSSGHRDAEN